MRFLFIAFLYLAAASVVMILAAYFLVDADELLGERMETRSYMSMVAMQTFANVLTITVIALTYGLASTAQVKGRAVISIGWFHFAIVGIQQMSSALATHYRNLSWAGHDISPMTIMTVSTVSGLLNLVSGLVFASVLILAMRAARRHAPTDVF